MHAPLILSKRRLDVFTHPTDKFLVAERMTLLTMEQHVGEHPRDFMVRINNQAALCDLAKLAANPVQVGSEECLLAD